MLLVDTNLFLEFLLGQKRAGEALAFLSGAQEKQTELVVSHFSAHALEAILSRANQMNALKKLLANLENAAHIHIYSARLDEEQQVIGLAEKLRLDFGDALQCPVARKTGCAAIVSFDAHFDKTDLPRRLPAEFL